MWCCCLSIRPTISQIFGFRGLNDPNKNEPPKTIDVQPQGLPVAPLTSSLSTKCCPPLLHVTLEDLPAGLLARIASSLSPRNCSSLRKTCKEVRGKLAEYANVLPKPSVFVEVYQEGRRIVMEVHLDGSHRHWISSLGPVRRNRMTAKEQLDHIKTFYRAHRGHAVMERRFNFGLALGISLHLKVLLAHVRIGYLHVQRLASEDYEYLGAITETMMHHGETVNDLVIDSRSMNYNHLDLIAACQPTTNLIIMPSVQTLPSGFYQLPAVRKVDHLIDDSRNKWLTQEELLSLECKSVDILGWSNMDSEMIKSLIKCWYETERDIYHLRLCVIKPAEVIREVWEMAKRDENLVGILHSRLDFPYLYSLTLQRIPYDSRLTISVNRFGDLLIEYLYDADTTASTS